MEMTIKIGGLKDITGTLVEGVFTEENTANPNTKDTWAKLFNRKIIAYVTTSENSIVKAIQVEPNNTEGIDAAGLLTHIKNKIASTYE